MEIDDGLGAFSGLQEGYVVFIILEENIDIAVDDFSRILSTTLQNFTCLMYKRIFDIENRLDEGMFLFGARQVGKSTLLRAS